MIPKMDFEMWVRGPADLVSYYDFGVVKAGETSRLYLPYFTSYTYNVYIANTDGASLYVVLAETGVGQILASAGMTFLRLGADVTDVTAGLVFLVGAAALNFLLGKINNYEMANIAPAKICCPKQWGDKHYTFGISIASYAPRTGDMPPMIWLKARVVDIR